MLIEVASRLANFNFIFLLVLIVSVYGFTFWKLKKNLVRAQLLSAVIVIGALTWLGMLMGPGSIWGGPGDRVDVVLNAGINAYVIYSIGLFVCGYKFFLKVKWWFLWLLLGLSILICQTLIFINLNLFIGAVFLIAELAMLMVSRQLALNKIDKKLKFRELLSRLLNNKYIAFSFFTLSIVWSTFYLYRQRELMFDCVLDANALTYRETMKAGNISITDLEKNWGAHDSFQKNYAPPSFSGEKGEDSTYFYCPKPNITGTDCRGYKITATYDGSVRLFQKRGSWACNSNKYHLLFFDLQKDGQYFFFWTKRMWNFQFPPTEHLMHMG